MTATPSQMLELGTVLPSFSLPDVKGAGILWDSNVVAGFSPRSYFYEKKLLTSVENPGKTGSAVIVSADVSCWVSVRER
jgi:hypothetical protein